MSLIDEIKQSDALQKYWGKLLGEETLEKLIESPEADALLRAAEVDKAGTAGMAEEILSAKGSADSFCTAYEFAAFYQHIAGFIYKKLKDRTTGIMEEAVIQKAAGQLTEKLNWLCIRCLIREMTQLKAAGRLEGGSSTAEYRYFEGKYLTDKTYVKSLFLKYPVMTQMIYGKTSASVAYIAEIVTNLEVDREKIVTQICGGRMFKKVADICLNLSDEHIQGKTVARIVLDNGCCVYYKPHDLKNLVKYQEIYAWVLSGLTMGNRTYRILDCGDHGWEMEIPHLPCTDKKEVERYYGRLGIQLCLAWVLGISDLHFENMIACGEYPVFIDLEVFLDRRLDLAGPEYDTVMYSGILPGNTFGGPDWNAGCTGQKRTQRGPYRLPVIVRGHTSDISITYEYPEMKPGKNVPVLSGQAVDFNDYSQWILYGFDRAYDFIMNHRIEQEKWMKEMSFIRSRYLLRNTQEYFMYQNSSNFPELMQRQEMRCMMLCAMNQGIACDSSFRERILASEIRCMLKNLIPVFYAEGKDLYAGDGECFCGYFQTDGTQQLKRRLERMSFKDKVLQKKYIRIALNMTEKATEEGADAGAGTAPDMAQGTAAKEMLTPGRAASLLLEEMQENNGQLSWIGLGYGAFGKRRAVTVGMYLYDGVSGIALFFTAMAMRDKKYTAVSRRLVRQMFAYIDAFEERMSKEVLQRMGKETEEAIRQDHSWGLFTGEMSLVLTCLMLYRMTGKASFLIYAVKQGNAVAAYDKGFTGADLLDGKAGIIISMLMLYSHTGNGEYIQIARKLGKQLTEEAVTMEEGSGWLCAGQKYPLAGMAHGSSGIALAFAYLYKYTGDNEGNIIEKALKYEDSLFRKAWGNWADIRGCGAQGAEGKDTLAWCHGAPGIVTARLWIEKMTGINVFKDTFGSARNAVKQTAGKIMKNPKTSLCLCHGMTGMAVMLRCWEKMTEESGLCHRYMALVNRHHCLSYEDRENPGLMTGLSGTGLGSMMLGSEKLFLEV